MSNTSALSISNTTKGKLPKLPFLAIKESALGKSWNLSLVFVGQKRSRTLNKKYRNKDKPTNVLSFSLSKNSGEIYINLPLAKTQAQKFDRTFVNFVGFLFIHGLFHLKGFDHGSTMEKAEEKLRRKFKI